MATTVQTAPSRPGPETGAGDGRSARRHRNREAVIDAMRALYDAGDLSPSTEAIAARAGVSPRSVFRYFDDVEDLLHTAIARQQEHLLPVLTRDVDTSGSRDDRVHRAVEHRLDVLHAMGSVGKVARLRAPFHAAIAAEVHRTRGEMRRIMGAALRPDLENLPRHRAEATLVAIDIACSFEALELLRDDLGLPEPVIHAQLLDAVHAHLTAAHAATPQRGRDRRRSDR